MRKFFCVIIILLSLLLDLLIGNSGFSVSVSAGVLLYLAGTAGMKTALWGAVLTGCCIDMNYARPEAFSVLVLPLSVGCGCYFMPKKEYRDQLYRSVFAGAAASGVFMLGNAAAVSLLYGKTGYPAGILAQFATSILTGTCGFPILILCLDTIAGKLNLPGYLTKLPADVAKLEKPEIEIETASGRRRKK